MYLFDDDIMLGQGYSNNVIRDDYTIYNWNYDEQSNVLATNAPYDNNNVLQWQLTMINDDNWTGMPLWTMKNSSTHAANNSIDAMGVAMLLNGVWENEAGETITFHSFRDTNDKYDGHSIWLEFSATEKPSVDLDKKHNSNKGIKFNRLSNKQRLIISYYDYDRDDDYYEGKTISKQFSLGVDNQNSYYGAEITQLLVSFSSYRNGKVITDYEFDARNYHRRK